MPKPKTTVFREATFPSFNEFSSEEDLTYLTLRYKIYLESLALPTPSGPDLFWGNNRSFAVVSTIGTVYTECRRIILEDTRLT